MLKGPVTLDFDQLEITFQKANVVSGNFREKRPYLSPPHQLLLTLVVSIQWDQSQPIMKLKECGMSLEILAPSS